LFQRGIARATNLLLRDNLSRHTTGSLPRVVARLLLDPIVLGVGTEK
jgi:hypothetical protein